MKIANDHIGISQSFYFKMLSETLIFVCTESAPGLLPLVLFNFYNMRDQCVIKDLIVIIIQLGNIVPSTNGQIQYSVKDNDFFSIDSRSGQIVLARPLDYEGKSTWEVTDCYLFSLHLQLFLSSL